MLARNKFLDSIGKKAAVYYNEISKGESFDASYLPSVEIKNDNYELENIEQAFEDKILRNKERERILQAAMVGPHRDDAEFCIRQYPARTHGSQGELRCAAIALKLAVFDYLMKIKGKKPILLLDDIFAELDDERKDMLVTLFENFGQIFITAVFTGTMIYKWKINNTYYAGAGDVEQ